MVDAQMFKNFTESTGVKIVSVNGADCLNFSPATQAPGMKDMSTFGFNKFLIFTCFKLS